MEELRIDLVKEEAARCLLCYDAPCIKACPANIEVAEIIRSLRFDNLAGAEEKLLRLRSLEESCAELCDYEKYCENACLRNKLDRAIEIESLHRFLIQEADRTESEVLADGS